MTDTTTAGRAVSMTTNEWMQLAIRVVHADSVFALDIGDKVFTHRPGTDLTIVVTSAQLELLRKAGYRP
jgi:hypothetical protein